MIHKSELKGKYIRFIDKNNQMRTQKVVKIVGNTLTVINAVNKRTRISKEQVKGREFPKRGLEEIDWSTTNKNKINKKVDI